MCETEDQQAGTRVADALGFPMHPASSAMILAGAIHLSVFLEEKTGSPLSDALGISDDDLLRLVEETYECAQRALRLWEKNHHQERSSES